MRTPHATRKNWMCRQTLMRPHVGALYLAFRPSLFRFTTPNVSQRPTPSNAPKAHRPCDNKKHRAEGHEKTNPKHTEKQSEMRPKTVPPKAQRRAKVRLKTIRRWQKKGMTRDENEAKKSPRARPQKRRSEWALRRLETQSKGQFRRVQRSCRWHGTKEKQRGVHQFLLSFSGSTNTRALAIRPMEAKKRALRFGYILESGGGSLALSLSMMRGMFSRIFAVSDFICARSFCAAPRSFRICPRSCARVSKRWVISWASSSSVRRSRKALTA